MNLRNGCYGLNVVMRKTFCSSRSTHVALALLVGLASAPFVMAAEKNAPAAAPDQTQNKLTVAETRDGWRLLFDGKSTDGWRTFKKHTFPDKGWVVVEGCLKHVAKGGGGDLISIDRFQEFDLQFDWKIAPGANSGLKYFITEERKNAIAHEYQLIDDVHHADGLRGGKWQTGGLYDCLPPKGGQKAQTTGRVQHIPNSGAHETRGSLAQWREDSGLRAGEPRAQGCGGAEQIQSGRRIRH
ncbi:MAG: DUF1080 domain-containing protein [Pedosphaera sp.]|nr:DUF1080 domain-containing protein [Pedosphaera sp.]